MPRHYTLVARVASHTNPDDQWEVKTDGQVLSCPCPIWRFNRQHDAQGRRTCRHVLEVQPRVDALGGLSAVLRLINRGVDVDLGSEAAARTARQAVQPAARATTGRRAGYPGVRPAAPPTAAASVPCDLECGNRFFSGHPTCRHGRTIEQSMATIRPAATIRRPAPAATGTDGPDLSWLGGGRLIILRD